MADVFVFSSPQKPVLTRRKFSASFYECSRITKKRRTTDDMFTQRACVARYDEPTFCPSNASALFTHESLLHIAAAANSSVEPMDLDEDYDDDTGGVALPPNDDDDDNNNNNDHMTSDLHNATSAQHVVQNSHDAQATSDIDSYRWPEPPSSLPGIPHRSDETQPGRISIAPIDTDHSARQRAQDAFEDAHVPAITQSGLSAALSHSPQESGDSVTFDTQEFVAAIISSTSSRHASRRASAVTSSQPLQRAEHLTIDDDASTISSPHEYIEMPLDDDALAVDDPQRNYDLADFMDTWRLRSLRDRQLPQFEPGLQPSVRLGQPRDISREQLISGVVDMQGMRWKLIGPTRDQAISARRMLHPSGIDSAFHVYKQRRTIEDTQYCFRSFNPTHRAKFNHYQLRNVLSASNRSEVFYATGNAVQQASLACPEVNSTVMDLSKPSHSTSDFRITCLSTSSRDTTNFGVLMAGGFYGEYALLNLDAPSSRPHEGFVTHAYNGLVTHVHNFADRRSGLLQAAFCSNDRSLRLMDVATLRFTSSFLYDNSINCAATSPDGRLRVQVGDSREVLITDASSGHSLVTLRDQNDHGFACDWSPHGRYVVAAAQDGKTIVWDARNWSEPVRTLYSSMSCARSVKFTNDGALVVAENDDVVRIYNSGSFKICQDINFFGSIAGVALIDGGAELAIANSDKTVGGLLTFGRSVQGQGRGSYGRIVATAGNYRRPRTETESVDGIVADTML